MGLQRELVKAAGVRERLVYTPVLDYGDDVKARVTAVGTEQLASAVRIASKTERNTATDAAAAAIIENLAGAFEGREREIKEATRSLTKDLGRKRIDDEGARIDGRSPTAPRALTAEAGVFA